MTMSEVNAIDLSKLFLDYYPSNMQASAYFDNSKGQKAARSSVNSATEIPHLFIDERNGMNPSKTLF